MAFAGTCELESSTLCMALTGAPGMNQLFAPHSSLRAYVSSLLVALRRLSQAPRSHETFLSLRSQFSLYDTASSQLLDGEETASTIAA